MCLFAPESELCDCNVVYCVLYREMNRNLHFLKMGSVYSLKHLYTGLVRLKFLEKPGPLLSLTLEWEWMVFSTQIWRKPECFLVGEDRKLCLFFTEEQNINNFITWKGYVDLVPLAANSAYWVAGGCYNVGDVPLWKEKLPVGSKCHCQLENGRK